MDPPKLTKNESEANRVIEYYNKYSLNPDLNKYFTGPEASFVKKRVVDFKVSEHEQGPEQVTTKSNELHNINESSCIIEPSSCNSEENTQSGVSLDVEINQIVKIDEVEEKHNSRSSSAASNKIEWDNGADIGYLNSYKLSTKKSASFPSLLTSNVSVKCNVLPIVSQEKSITENKEELRKMYHQLTFSSDTSNSSNNLYSKEPSVKSSSSSQENRNLKISTQSSSSNNSVHRKIGNPVAYSTPHEGSSSKGSNSSSPIPQEGTTSKSSDKYEGYTVTPMLTLPINKRKLNNNKPLESSEEHVKKECGPKGYENNLSKKNAASKMDPIQKKINLCLTKPISVECISVESKPIVHKDVQTSFSSEKSSKCVQTEGLELDDIIFKPVPVRSPLAQKIEYVRFHSGNSKSGSEKSETRSDKKPASERFVPTKGSPVVYTQKNSKTTQTELVLREKTVRSRKTTLESKEHKKNVIGKESRTQMKTKNVDSSEVSSSVNSSRHTSDDKMSTSGNAASTECGYKTAVAVEDFQTEELLLTEMISLNHSSDLNTDIKRSIDILQKLLKSKKYDQATKKHYIKKIVQKIVDSKYSDDSTNSDFFRPKKSSSDHRYVPKSENKVPNVKATSELMENKPWYPVSEPVYTMTKTKSKRSKSEKMTEEKKPDLSPRENNNLIYSNVIRNHTFRLPIQKEYPEIPQEASVPTATTSKKNDKKETKKGEIIDNFTKESSRFTSNSSSRLAYSTSFDKENRPTSSDGKNSSADWRTSKTISEKILENRDNVDFKKGQGDYLLNVVKNERHHQLSWINNEIEHLVKLKQLLEKKPKDLKPEAQLKDVISSLLKMKVDDMKVKSPSPLQEVQNTGTKTYQSTNSRKELQTQDQTPPIPSNSLPNQVPFTENPTDLQIYMCTTQTPTNNKKLSEQKCSCSLDMCKCNQTTTHEEKDVQCPASKQCQCQTEPKEDAKVQCNCKVSKNDETTKNEEKLCECKKSSSSSSSDSQSDTESYMSCICCKKEKILKNLIKKIPLCEPCQEVNQKNFYPHSYTNPLHSCMCYKLVDCDILYQFKQTLTEIERLDIYQQYCEVLKNCKCCKECGCKCKLPKRFKNGCAYFLKLEDACPNTHCEEYDSDFDSSDYDEGEDGRGNDLPEVTVKVPNCRGSCARKRENGRDKETKKYKSCPSIQNYLCTMKPDFVERAERRRRILKDATSQREENSEKRKLKFIDRINYLNQKKRNEKFSSETDVVKTGGYQTKAYCVFDIELNESPKRVRPRIFKSFKEMKELTRRKYLHLNEVTSKKDIHREKRLREANRLLANTFTRRLQRSTLRGAVDIPLNVKVVSY